jgi:hypothetical protein
MGCDIHVYLERRWNGQWVGLTNPTHHDNITDRNYTRFTKLAGVRADPGNRTCPQPKGLPGDASLLVQMFHDDWDADAHSASWETLRDFVRICLETEHDPAKVFLDPDDPRGKDPYWYYFGLYIDDINIDNYRVVFWFDN